MHRSRLGGQLSRPARVALGLGLMYAAVLIVAALTFHVASSETAGVMTGSSSSGGGVVASGSVQTTTTVHRTAVQRDGTKVLLIVGAPLVLLLGVTAELRWCRRWGHPGPGGFTVLVVLLLFPLSVLGLLTVGPFVVPLLGVVSVAAATEYSDRASRRVPAPPPPPRRAGLSPPAPWGG